MISKISVIIVFFLASFITEIKADTIYLRNGNRIEGLITEENDKGVELDVGFGTVKFSRQEIKSIYKSSQEETALIRKEWERQAKAAKGEQIKREKDIKRDRRKRALEARKKLKLKEIEFSQMSEHIIVDALLNKKVKTRLLLDTGASNILLSSRIAKDLGIEINAEKKEIGKVKMADGHEVDAMYVVLDSVNVQDVEAKGVGAVVLLEDAEMEPHDGLLGMSFLNKFNFKIDTLNKKLILERLK